jgi:hypothetical protein
MRPGHPVPDRKIAIATLLLVGGAACGGVGPSSGPSGGSATTQSLERQSTTRPATLPTISAEILGPVAKVKGHAWPRGYDWVYKREDQPLSQTLADRPHHLVLALPSGRTVEHDAVATFFTQKRHVVNNTSLMPHAGVLRYQEAITLLEQILKEWDAHPDERSAGLVAEWKKEGDLQPWEIAQRRGSAIFRGEDRCGIYFEIRPAKAGWFVTVDVNATLEEERKLWGPPPP